MNNGKVALIIGFTAGCLSMCILICTPVLAAPKGGQSRGAAITRQGKVTDIDLLDRNSIINWHSYNLAADETVNYRWSQAELARSLNRINQLGGVSEIAGLINAPNVQLYFVNPAGIYFSGGARINAASLYAAAAEMTDRDFLNGVDLFSHVQGSVVNHGNIDAQFVSLIGGHVGNHGVINAPEGLVTMLAGDRVLLSRNGDRVYVEIDGLPLSDGQAPRAGSTTPDLTAEPGVENTGRINAPRGGITLGAGDMYSLAIKNCGNLKAEGGRIAVIAHDGAVDNSGTMDTSVSEGRAGDITVNAPTIVHTGRIHADSEAGTGGSVRVISNDHTLLLDHSVISAAGGAGMAHGGDVLVHSYNGLTVFGPDALVDVSSGGMGGSGGFAEVSGYRLDMHGFVDLFGQAEPGTLLIDPYDLYIEEVGRQDIVNGLISGDGFYNIAEIIEFDDYFVSEHFFDMSIGYQVLQNYNGDIILQAMNDIFVNYQLDFSQYNNNLTLEAFNNINFNAPVFNANDLVVHADYDGDGYGSISLRSELSGLNSLLFDGEQINLNVNGIATAGTQTYNGHVYLLQGTSFTAGGSGVLFNGMVDGPFGLEVNGNALFAGDIGSQIYVMDLMVSGDAELKGEIIQTQGDQHYQADVTLSSARTDMRTSSGRIFFDAKVDGNSELHIAGPVTLGGDVGSNQPLKELVVDDQIEINAASVRTDRLQQYNGPVSLGSTQTTLSSRFAGVNFDSTVDGACSLLIDGSAYFGNSVGMTQPLSELAVNRTSFVAGSIIRTTGNQSYKDMTIASDTVFEGQTVSFSDIVNGISRYDTMTVDGNVEFYETVGHNMPLYSLSVIGDTLIEGGLVSTVHMQEYFGKFNVGDDTHLAIQNGYDIFEPAIVFHSTVNGAHQLTIDADVFSVYCYDAIGNETPLAGLDIQACRTFLNGGYIDVAGDIKLAFPKSVLDFDYISETIPRMATVISENDLLEIHTDNFQMSRYSKLSVLGDLHLYCDRNTGVAWLSDVNTLNDMVISASKINLITRDPGYVYTNINEGSDVLDQGMDLIAGGEYDFSVTPTVTGDGPTPRFGSPRYPLGDRSGLLSDYSVRTMPVDREDFILKYVSSLCEMRGGYFADLLIVPGPPVNDLANTFAAGQPAVQDTVIEEVMLGPDAREALAALQLDIMPLDNNALQSRTAGRHVINDYDDRTTSDNDMVTVSAYKIRRSSAVAVIDKYLEIFTVQSVDPETGESGRYYRTFEIRQAIEESWNAFQELDEAGSMADYLSFVMESPDYQEVFIDYSDLKELFRRIETSGLSAAEYTHVENAVLAAILPDGMDVQLLRQMINSTITIAEQAAPDITADTGLPATAAEPGGA